MGNSPCGLLRQIFSQNWGSSPAPAHAHERPACTRMRQACARKRQNVRRKRAMAGQGRTPRGDGADVFLAYFTNHLFSSLSLSLSLSLFSSYSVLRAFPLSQYNILSVTDQFCKNRIAVSAGEHRYALYLESKIGDLEHAFNMGSGQKRFLHSTPDMWSPSLK